MRLIVSQTSPHNNGVFWLLKLSWNAFSVQDVTSHFVTAWQQLSNVELQFRGMLGATWDSIREYAADKKNIRIHFP